MGEQSESKIGGYTMPNELRPSEILWAYWDQVLAIEEDALRLQAEYLEAA